jgi:hypothetical protein
MIHYRSSVISLTTILFVIIISGVFRIQDPSCDFSATHRDPEIFQKNETTKYILLWTKFFIWRNWKLKQATLDHRYFEGIGCPETRCVITSNRSLLPTLFFDAFLFHGAENWVDVPRVKRKEQYYVFALRESPAGTFHPLKTRNNFFNWTSKMGKIIIKDIMQIFGY